MELIERGMVEICFKNFSSNSSLTRTWSCGCIRNLCQSNILDEDHSVLHEKGVVDAVFSLVRDNTLNVRYQAIACIVELTRIRGSSHIRLRLFEMGIVTIYEENLDCGNENLMQACLAGLRNITIEREVKRRIDQDRLIRKVVPFLKSSAPDIITHAACFLWNVAVNNVACKPVVIESGAVPMLFELLVHEDKEVIQSALGCLQCLTEIKDIVEQILKVKVFKFTLK